MMRRRIKAGSVATGSATVAACHRITMKVEPLYSMLTALQAKPQPISALAKASFCSGTCTDTLKRVPESL